MISVLIVIMFLACYLFYNTSQKTSIVFKSYLEKSLGSNKQLSKIIGGSLLLISLIIASINFGLFTGSLFWLSSLMLLMSLLILITPLNIVNYKLLVILFLVLLLIEIFL